MMRLFISSAEEDASVVSGIVSLLGQHGVEICSRDCSDVTHEHPSRAVEDLISQADAFLAVVSPDFVGSAPCRREKLLALHAEGVRMAAGQQRFIYVLRVREIPFDNVADLRNRPWVEPAAGRGWADAIDRLRSVLPPGGANPTTLAAARDNRQAPRFQNRESELDSVLDGLTGVGGSPFWLLIAPPQLGKSWFLDRIASDIHSREPDSWRVKLVDLRDKPADVRRRPELLLGMLFGRDGPVPTDPDSLEELAADLVHEDRFHLCLLDSAELLDKETADTLRKCLSDVHELVKSAAYEHARLCLIVASRRDTGWRGVSHPRLRIQRLTEFSPEIIEAALRDMAVRMRHRLGTTDISGHAAVIHRQCEGLPALLHSYLSWVQDKRFIDLRRLDNNRQFVKLTRPYIEQQLLSRDSLFPAGAEPTQEERDSVLQTLTVLAPYRLLCQAHVSHHARPGEALQPFVEQGWTVEKFWRALGETDLLTRPQLGAWHVIPAPIRRLLCRFWYPSDDSLAYAHYKAEQFIRYWGDRQSGTDKTLALVERIWHRSQVLRLNHEVNPADKLIVFAEQLSRELPESAGFTQEELRTQAANALGEDEEIAQAAAHINVVFDELVNAVRMP